MREPSHWCEVEWNKVRMSFINLSMSSCTIHYFLCHTSSNCDLTWGSKARRVSNRRIAVRRFQIHIWSSYVSDLNKIAILLLWVMSARIPRTQAKHISILQCLAKHISNLQCYCGWVHWHALRHQIICQVQLFVWLSDLCAWGNHSKFACHSLTYLYDSLFSCSHLSICDLTWGSQTYLESEFKQVMK